ncbi:MAG: DHH family phosphoesterase [Actinomycetes bacterium]|jgi:phosphoesterase RecJ-like protein|nr:DHH family phosphoesterase [Actinomycetes bacterium]
MEQLRKTLGNMTPQSGMRMVVCGHTRPDGDCVGSVLGMTRALRCQGFDATALLADNNGGKGAPEPYRWMSGWSEYVHPCELEQQAPPNLFVALDTPELVRLSDARALCEAADLRILIDHHPASEGECFAELIYRDTEAAATGQIVWNLLGQLGWPRDAEIASCCYAALLSDTGGFQFANTTREAFAAAGEMLAAGAEPSTIACHLYGEKPLAALQLEARVLSRACLLNDGLVIHSYLSDADLQELGVGPDWTENLIDLIRPVAGSEVAVLITHGAKGPRVSLRSRGDTDVSAVAVAFGGGGHRLAAGISWPDKCATREEILEQLLPLLPGASE